MSIREADMTDLDAMVDVCLAALAMDPQWDYREQYPEAHSDSRANNSKLFSRTSLKVGR